MSMKILAVGSAFGSLRSLFTKVKAIDAKHGKFELLLCTGDFFGPISDQGGNDVGDLLAGNLEAPMTTYVIQGDLPIPPAVIEKAGQKNGEIAHNVILLGKSEVVTTPQGLRVASFGGIYEPEKYVNTEEDPSSPYFTVKNFQALFSHPCMTPPKSTHANPNSLAALRAAAAAPPSYIDILLTHTWPSVITQFSSTELPDTDAPSCGAIQVDEIIRRALPRYHFTSGGGKFWEREPFGWTDVTEEGRMTRFVSLGRFGGQELGKKQRWFYAFSITPLTSNSTPHVRPSNATLNPFRDEPSPTRPPKRSIEPEPVENYIWGNVGNPRGAKRGRYDKGPQSNNPPSGYVCKRCSSKEHYLKDCPEKAPAPPEGYICKACNMTDHFIRDCPSRNALGDSGGKKPPEGYVCRACASDAHYIKDCPLANTTSRERRAPPKEIGPDECWFCLSNPRLAKHLIIAIGAECYLTLPKGQIPETIRSDNNKGSRTTTMSPIPGGGHALIVPISHYPTLLSVPHDLAVPIISEIEQYRSALRACYAKYDASPVSFEVARLSGKGGHAHVQVVPVPNSVAHTVEDAFRQEGTRMGIEFEPDPESALSGRDNYFRVDLPDGKKLVHLLKPGKPFNLQFGRLTLAGILGLPERVDWKACAQSDDEDRQDASTFKAAFASFDITQ